MLITDEYRQMNTELHASRADYGASSSQWANHVLALAEQIQTRDILDYGCGKGQLKHTLNWPIHEYDPAIPGKDALPKPADLVICTDVLEHIEPACLESVLDDLQRVTRQAAFLNVATVPARKTLPDGRNAHLIVQPLSAWLPLLWERFTLLVVENGPKGFSVVVASKHWNPWP